MNQPLISVLHPTCRTVPTEAFPRGWRDAYDAWLATCDDPKRVEYIIIVHTSRYDDFIKSELLQTAEHYKWNMLTVIRNEGRDCAVDQCNAGGAAMRGVLYIGAQDDLYPPQHWDTMALDSLPRKTCPDCDFYQFTERPAEGWFFCERCKNQADMEGEYVVRCSSGSQRDDKLTIAGFTSVSRAKRYGYCLSPEFESMFSDDYFDWNLRKDAEAGITTVIERPDIQFEHRHPLFGKGTVDKHYEAQNRPQAYRQGFATFKKLTEGTRVIAACLPGENFGHWVASSITRLLRYMDKGPRFIADDYWLHTSNVYSTRIELADAVMGGGSLQGGGAKPDLVYWQDDDNPVTPEQFEALLADLDAHPELDGVVGWCWCDTGDYEQHAFMMSCGRQGPNLECKPFTMEDIQKAAKSGRPAITSDDIAPDAFWSGFPVVLMRSSVLEKVGWEAFQPMIGKQFRRGFTSEDTTFFYRCHKAGLKFAVDLRVKVPHLKIRGIEPYLSQKEQEAIMDAMGVALAPKENAMEISIDESIPTITPDQERTIKAAHELRMMSDGPHGMVAVETVTAN